MANIRYQEPTGGKPSSIEVSQSLTGLDFPANRDQIINYARQKGASDRILSTLEELTDTSFQNLNIMLRNLNM